MTSRLSYCMWFTILITLDFVLSTTILPISIDLTDTENSEKLNKNTANSKIKANLKWEENSTQTSMENSLEAQVSWAEDEIPEDNSEAKESKEWNAKMRKLTRKQLEKWKLLMKRNEETEKIKNCSSYRAVNKNDEKDVNNNKSKSPSEVDSSSSDLKDKKNKNVKDYEIKFANIKKKLLSKKYDNFSESNVLDDDKLTDRPKYQTGRWGMSMKIPPKEFLKETSTGREENGKKIRMKIKNKPKEIKIHNEHEEIAEEMLEFSNDSTTSELSKISPTKESQKELEKNNSQEVEFLNITSASFLPKEESLTKKLIVKTGRRNLEGNHRTGGSPIKPASKDRKIFAPIIIFSPVVWMLKLPVDIKQQLGVVPDELANPSRDIHFMNSSIILGQMRAAWRVENNKQDENNDYGSISNVDQITVF